MRKQGKKYKSIAVVPLGVKSSKYEMDARAAIVALQNDVANRDHLVSLYVLADLCEKLNDLGEAHINTHSASVKRLCQTIFEHEYRCGALTAASMLVSVDLLLVWFHQQPNKRIADVALRELERLAE